VRAVAFPERMSIEPHPFRPGPCPRRWATNQLRVLISGAPVFRREMNAKLRTEADDGSTMCHAASSSHPRSIRRPDRRQDISCDRR